LRIPSNTLSTMSIGDALLALFANPKCERNLASLLMDQGAGAIFFAV
jgi:hypothetical protein